MEPNEQTPLIATVRIAPPRQRHERSVVRRFFTIAFSSTLIVVVFFMLLPLPHRPTTPIVDTQTCYSSLNTSKAYASAEALNNNINDFCQDVVNNVPLITFGWTRSKTYYPHTPEEYTMTVALSNRVFRVNFDQRKCTDAMSSIINDCDVPAGGSNPMNWKQGGERIHGEQTYRIDIFRQNRPWPPPDKPRQSCEGWYKFILQHYDIYGAGWSNYDWGQKGLKREINPCCGWGKSKSTIQMEYFSSVTVRYCTVSVSDFASNIGSLTGWNFEYFDQPDENGYEVREVLSFRARFTL